MSPARVVCETSDPESADLGSGPGSACLFGNEGINSRPLLLRTGTAEQRKSLLCSHLITIPHPLPDDHSFLIPKSSSTPILTVPLILIPFSWRRRCPHTGHHLPQPLHLLASPPIYRQKIRSTVHKLPSPLHQPHRRVRICREVSRKLGVLASGRQHRVGRCRNGESVDTVGGGNEWMRSDEELLKGVSILQTYCQVSKRNIPHRYQPRTRCRQRSRPPFASRSPR